MKCLNCNANCFSTTDIGCIAWSGGAIASLGIKDGDSVKEVIAKLIESNIKLQDKISKCNLCNQEDYVDNTQQSLTSLEGLSRTSTTCSAAIYDSNISYTVTGTTNSVSVLYSFQNIEDNIPSNYSIVKRSVRVWGSGSDNTLYSSSSNNSGNITVSPDKFPLKLDFSIQIATPCGLASIDKIVLLNGVSNGTYSATGIITDYGTENHGVVTQDKYNEVIRDKVIALERDLNSIKNLNVNGGTTLLPSKDIETVIQSILNKL